MPPIRILHVDDIPSDTEKIAALLAQADLRVIVDRVDTERDFREKLATGSYHVILSDYLHGLEALKIAQELAPEVPFIFLSEAAGEDRAIEALMRGATDYVLKERPSRLSAAITRALGDVRDSHQRRLMRDALQRSEERFRYAARATHDVIWEWSLDSNHVWRSDSLVDEWGYRPEEVEPTLEWWSSRIHPDEVARVSEALARAAKSPSGSFAEEYRFRRSDGSWSIVLDRGTLVNTGGSRRMIGAMQDITERARLQEQLARSLRVESLGRVAATVAHEFNNVLMAIQPFATIVQLRAGDDEKLAQAGAQIIDAVQRGRRITETIRQTTVAPRTSPERIEIGPWLRGIHEGLQGIAGPSVKVDLVVQDGELYARCDPGQLHQVLGNLVANARDASPPGGRITITANRKSALHRIVICVSDRGAGIPSDALPHIFDPLFTTKKHGTGVGLSVVEQLVRANGGSVSVDTDRTHGTTFEIVLPEADEPERE